MVVAGIAAMGAFAVLSLVLDIDRSAQLALAIILSLAMGSTAAALVVRVQGRKPRPGSARSDPT